MKKTKHLDLLIFCLVVQTILGFAFSQVYLLYRNTLYHNKNWVSTKISLEKGVMGAVAFATKQQALAKRQLNLGSWFGYQEVTYKDSLNIKEVRFDFLPDPESYFHFIFHRQKGGYRGIRLSGNRHFDSIYYKASDLGQFVEKKRVVVDNIQTGKWHAFHISFLSDKFKINLDGETILEIGDRLLKKQKIGFRGGFKNVGIDNLVIQLYNGSKIYDSFNYPKNSLLIIFIIIFVSIFLNMILLLLLSLLTRFNFRTIGLALSMVHFVLMFLFLFAYLFQYVHGGSYSSASEEMRLVQKYWVDSSRNQILAKLKKTYGGEKKRGTYRIVFLGSSQTWGAGAAREEETFVRVTEKMLNRGRDKKIRFECINGGISATVSGQMLDFFETELLSFKPDMVILNLANNDTNVEVFKTNAEKMVRLAQKNRIRPVLLLEPNSVERKPDDTPHGDLLHKHAILKNLARSYKVPVIDMHSHLLDLKDTGFLWWDFVHLSSYGQKLFAEKLYGELIRMFPPAIGRPETLAPEHP